MPTERRRQNPERSSVKQSFLGIELDILVGHPEHDILFIATQVARAAGLKNPAGSINAERSGHGAGVKLPALIQDHCISLPKDAQGRALRSTTVLFTEPQTYQMLLRGHAPQSEPFRKWVTEIVLPSIRKTGTYDLFASETKEAQKLFPITYSASGVFVWNHAKFCALVCPFSSAVCNGRKPPYTHSSALSSAKVAPPVTPEAIRRPTTNWPGVSAEGPSAWDMMGANSYAEANPTAIVTNHLNNCHNRHHPSPRILISA